MTKRFVSVFCLLVFAALYLVALQRSGLELRTLPRSAEGAGTLPAPFIKVLALEFDGLAADMLFVDALVFHGESLERTTKPRLQDWEWGWLFKTLETVTEIDPWFYDPYYFANAFFPWEGQLIEETDRLLERGAQSRDWDWSLPFYAGFNEFYFLQNNDRAAELLMMASKRPGAPTLIPSLAARLAYRGDQTETAIRFLVEFMQSVESPAERAQYETRLQALKGIYILEQAVKAYQGKFKRTPLQLIELVALGLLRDIPEDPYGGRFYLEPGGTIKTTSKLRHVR